MATFLHYLASLVLPVKSASLRVMPSFLAPPPSSAGHGPECAVCLCRIGEGGEASRDLRCKHTFHKLCLERWTELRRTCPLCRDYLPLSDDDDDEEEEHDEEFLAGPNMAILVLSPYLDGNLGDSWWIR